MKNKRIYNIRLDYIIEVLSVKRVGKKKMFIQFVNVFQLLKQSRLMINYGCMEFFCICEGWKGAQGALK